MMTVEPVLFEPMSPARFAPLDGLGGTCALARDTDFRMVWCNDELGRIRNKTNEQMWGESLHDTMPKAMADERAKIMRPVLEEGKMITYHQLWRGARWLTRVWPLDPEAFGHRGYFVVLVRLAATTRKDGHDGPTVQLVRSADLADLGVLSRREIEIYYYLAAGLTVVEIGAILHRSHKTIGRHVEGIHAKMGYSTRAELVRDAVSRGLVSFSAGEWRAMTDPKGS